MANQEQLPDGAPHKAGDSAPLGPPGAGLSNRNGPSDPDNRKQ